MVGNASPLIAVLFLLAVEFIIMNNLVNSTNPQQIALDKLSSNYCRYIDDMLVFNVNNFNEVAKLIYPNSIPLTQSNNNNEVENVLDININIINEKFTLKIYHKVDYFNFSVINFPFPDSIVDDISTYNCLYSQLVRFSQNKFRA